MQRFSDNEIIGVYQPRGLGRAIAEGEPIQCARLHCARAASTAGARSYKWAPRQMKRPAIELCARCHKELATIVFGG